MVDGGSIDETLSILNNSQDIVTKYISENDNGIFDAMNKGIAMSSGNWLIFINSGDEIRFSNELIKTLRSNLKSAIVYGNTLRKNNLLTKPKDLSAIRNGSLPMCHQSTFYNKVILKDVLHYKTKFKLFGENELLMRLYKAGHRMKYIDTPISFFEGGGISDFVSWETRVARYYYVFYHFGFIQLVKSLIVRFRVL